MPGGRFHSPCYTSDVCFFFSVQNPISIISALFGRKFKMFFISSFIIELWEDINLWKISIQNNLFIYLFIHASKYFFSVRFVI